MINADPLKNGTLQKKKNGTVWYGQDDKFGRTTVYKELKICGRYRIQSLYGSFFIKFSKGDEFKV